MLLSKQEIVNAIQTEIIKTELIIKDFKGCNSRHAIRRVAELYEYINGCKFALKLLIHCTREEYELETTENKLNILRNIGLEESL